MLHRGSRYRIVWGAGVALAIADVLTSAVVASLSDGATDTARTADVLAAGTPQVSPPTGTPTPTGAATPTSAPTSTASTSVPRSPGAC